MLFIIDKKMPSKAKANLSLYGEIIEITSEDITYKAISGHPDIFFCKTHDGLIIAPNIYDEIKPRLKTKTPIIKGIKSLSNTYPETAFYNAIITNTHLIHNLNITDDKILEQSSKLSKIHINQGYSRCNTLPLPNNTFITSDKSTCCILNENKLDSIYVNPEKIELPSFKNGFFGGCCGVYNKTVFICGSLNSLENKSEVGNFIEKAGCEIIELYGGNLFDCGSIIIL